jgi:hypothetical protein
VRRDRRGHHSPVEASDGIEDVDFVYRFANDLKFVDGRFTIAAFLQTKRDAEAGGLSLWKAVGPPTVSVARMEYVTAVAVGRLRVGALRNLGLELRVGGRARARSGLQHVTLIRMPARGSIEETELALALIAMTEVVDVAI